MQSGNSSPKPSTPSAQIRSVQLSDLSPPNSQGVPLPSTSTTATTAITADTMPTAAPSVSGANMNGKRPISSIEQSQELLGAAASVMPTDAQSAAVAYQWTNPEDAPGYAWRNKKAQDEYNRAYESLVDKNRKIGSMFFLFLLPCNTGNGPSYWS
jgi:hypothetical protein